MKNDYVQIQRKRRRKSGGTRNVIKKTHKIIMKYIELVVDIMVVVALAHLIGFALVSIFLLVK